MVGPLSGGSSSLKAVGFVALLVYANTLLGDFTFDDNFAVVGLSQLQSAWAGQGWRRTPAHPARKPPNCRLQTEMSLMLPSPSRTFSSMTFGEESRAAACRLLLPHTC